MLSLNFIQLFTLANAARCDPNDVRACLATFETQFLSCDPNDLACQCGLVLSQGSVCFDGCPEEALDEFVTTYADGVCRKAEAHTLDNEYGYHAEELLVSENGRYGTESDEHSEQKFYVPEQKPKKSSWWRRIRGKNSHCVAAKQHSKSSSGEFPIQTVPYSSSSTVKEPSKPATTLTVAAFDDQELNKAFVPHFPMGDLKAQTPLHNVSEPSASTVEQAGEKAGEPASAVHGATHLGTTPLVAKVSEGTVKESSATHEAVPSAVLLGGSSAKESVPVHQPLSDKSAGPQVKAVKSESSKPLVESNKTASTGTTKRGSVAPFSQKAYHLGSAAVDGARKNGTSLHSATDPTKQADISPLNELKMTLIAASIVLLSVLFV